MYRTEEIVYRILQYIKPEEIIQFALINKTANKTLDSNRYRTDKTFGYSIHLEIILAIQNRLNLLFHDDSLYIKESLVLYQKSLDCDLIHCYYVK